MLISHLLLYNLFFSLDTDMCVTCTSIRKGNCIRENTSLAKLYNFLNSSSVCNFQPEWYLTQVLMWMGNSSAFMEEKIQPILDRAEAPISAMVCCNSHKLTDLLSTEAPHFPNGYQTRFYLFLNVM